MRAEPVSHLRSVGFPLYSGFTEDAGRRALKAWEVMLSGSVPFYTRTEASPQLQQIPSGNRRSPTTGVCASPPSLDHSWETWRPRRSISLRRESVAGWAVEPLSCRLWSCFVFYWDPLIACANSIAAIPTSKVALGPSITAIGVAMEPGSPTDRCTLLPDLLDSLPKPKPDTC